MASGQGSNWLIESPATFQLCVTQIPEICYMSTLFVNIFALLAVTQFVDNLFHSCDSFCENEYLFPMNTDPILMLVHVLYVSYFSCVKKISINVHTHSIS